MEQKAQYYGFYSYEAERCLRGDPHGYVPVIYQTVDGRRVHCTYVSTDEHASNYNWPDVIAHGPIDSSLPSCGDI